MKKHHALFLCIVLAVNLHAIDLKYVNLAQIRHIKAYEDEIVFILNNQQYLKTFIPDSFWKSPYSKAELTAKLKTAYEEISRYPENDNQEYLLLKAAVAEFLYHLGETHFRQIVIDNYTEIEKIPGKDYRYKWFSGFFYALAAEPFKAIHEFEYVVRRIPPDKLHPDFFYDYAYVQVLAHMPKNALANFTRFFSLTQTSSAADSLYKSLTANFPEYTDKTDLDFTNLFVPYEREDKTTGFFSRLLGLWLPVKDDWEMVYSGLQDNVSVIKFKSPVIAHPSGKNITFSILLMSVIGGDAEMGEKWEKQLPDLQKKDIGLKLANTAFEYEDGGTYADIGGSRGYFITITSDYSIENELAVEKPAKLITGASGAETSYLPLQKEYSRYKGTVTHYILLDSCNYIFEESKTALQDFVNGSDFR